MDNYLEGRHLLFKRILLLGFVVFFSRLDAPLWSQEGIQRVMEMAQRDSIPFYKVAPDGLPSFKVRMDFEESLVLNPDDLSELPAYDIVAIDLVYTLFPKGKNFENLNRERLKALEGIFPTLLQKNSIQWRFIGQSRANSRSQALRLFHGFVVYYHDFTPFLPLPPLPEEESGEDEGPDYGDPLVMYQLLRKGLVSDDSVVYKIFQRNRDLWREAILVTDWTASMYPYGFDFLVWLKKNALYQKNFKGFVFFNDGDGKQTGEKMIGNTGGIYYTASRAWVDILKMMARAQKNGTGGYNSENDLEALLRAQQYCPDCAELVLIADSRSYVRDLLLLDVFTQRCQQNQQKLRVVLCGLEEKIVYDYLYMVAKVGGSVHTLDQDIFDIQLDDEGRMVDGQGEGYRYLDGQFILRPLKKSKSRKKARQH